MAAPSRRLCTLIRLQGNSHVPLICNSCIRYMSANPPDGHVSPPGFIKRYIVDHIVNFVSKRTEKLERRYPKVFEIYRTFRSGSSTFVSETKDYYNVTTELWGGRTLGTFSRHQLEVYKQIPRDLFRIAPILLISVLPWGGAIIALAYLYPRIFLSHHFWTQKQREKFWRQTLESRLHHTSAILDWTMRQSIHVPNQKKRDKLVRLIQKLEHAVQPSIEELLEVLPLFASFPYQTDRMATVYMRHLARCLNFWPLRARLYHDAMILLYTDLAMAREGIVKMDDYALEKACFLRSLNPFGLTREEKIAYLTNWTRISQEIDESNISFLLHCPAFLGGVHPNNLQLLGGKRSFWRKKTGR
ncbi:LETM1 domain-containing protein 1-like [Haliotis rubra]|uniref:LETM1 domain-containing protein 1-like n=1 Tax=Haliotis rubra TaxID=36100 RepID=UPI001EE5DBB7|nr:LETM1 domain-containing protein 1-like [Haliotis rubra]